ncbi:MAG: lipoprotein insertase outer membrane protein LolB [Nitrosomonas halophila]
MRFNRQPSWLIDIIDKLFAGHAAIAKLSSMHGFCAEKIWRIQQWLCVCLILTLTLTSCAGPEIRPAAITTTIIPPAFEQQESMDRFFMLVGRLAVKTDQQKFSGSVRWRHTAHEDEIYLFSPLGQVVAEIYRDRTGVRLTTSEPAIYRAATAEQLTAQVLGWELPLAGLRYWVRGRHFPMTVAEKDTDRDHRTVAIRQDGWQIAYLDYYPEQAAQSALPRLLEFTRADMKMKLVVDQWQNEHATRPAK